MHLLRIFLAILISIALPFANVAAAAMVHCAPSAGAAQEAVLADAHDAGMHAHQHAQQDGADQHHHHAAGKPVKNGDGCSQCSYCQSCASAFFPAAAHRTPTSSASDIRHSLQAAPPPTSLAEQLYRPPRPAFA